MGINTQTYPTLNALKEYNLNFFKEYSEKTNSSATYLNPTVELETYHKLICKYFDDFSGNWQVYIPSERNLFSYIDNVHFYLSQNKLNDRFDYILNETGALYSSILPLFENRNVIIEKRTINRLYKKFQEIIKGDISFKKNNGKVDVYIVNKDREILLSSSSSGQITSIPLFLLLMCIYEFSYSNATKKVVYIEEPEAHLYPAAQKIIIEIISIIYKEKGIRVFITTHSPYILTSSNNLLLANEVNKKKNKNIELTLNGENFSAYSLNGESKDIFIKENSVIDADVIDAVSEVIAEDFKNYLDEIYG